MVVSAHADIGVFFAYRAGFTRKNLPKPRTYMVVLQTVAYVVAHKVFKVYNDQKSFFMCNMVLEWREREHGYVEEAVQGDLMAQQDFHACGLYKFWCLGSLRAKPRLLQMLVDTGIQTQTLFISMRCPSL